MEQQVSEVFAELAELRLKAGLDTPVQRLQWLRHSAHFNAVHWFSNLAGRVNGYAVWAKVNRETLRRQQRTGQFPRYFYEWNEGQIMLLLDVVFIDGWHRHNQNQLRRFIKSHKAAAWFRREQLHLLIRKQGVMKHIPIPFTKTLSS
jgi:hemolysin-activating ACP:hemolysin acyltransferase